MRESPEPDLAGDGARRFPGLLNEDCRAIEAEFGKFALSRPGVRLHGAAGLAPYNEAAGPIGRLAAALLGRAARPVRAILFDNSNAANWALGWHQDRIIVVQTRCDSPGLGAWTIKSGLTQTEPPFDILERMGTLGVHLDAVDAGNGPLAVLPGSHRLGRLSEDRINDLVATSRRYLCLAERGDIWAYSTPIVHASAAANPPSRRRVLQLDYSADTLPPPRAWRGL